MPNNTTLGKSTTKTLIGLVSDYDKAKATVNAIKILFDTGLDTPATRYNPFDCEYRETYRHQTLTGGNIYRCRKGETPNTSFDRCRDCDINRCPLTDD